MTTRKLTSLTDDEIREIVNALFRPKKITCIKRWKKADEITCKIYTEWDPEDPVVMCDELVMENPFASGCALHVDFSLSGEDYRRYRQMCIEKGVLPTWLENSQLVWKADVLDVLDEMAGGCDGKWYAEFRKRIDKM